MDVVYIVEVERTSEAPFRIDSVFTIFQVWKRHILQSDQSFGTTLKPLVIGKVLSVGRTPKSWKVSESSPKET